MITLDTSGLFAALNADEKDHERVRAALLADPGPYILPAGILGEVTYLVEQRLHLRVLDQFLADVAARLFVLDCGEDDFPRIRALVRRYADMPLGFADAAVIACAKRNGGRVLTLDVRHFGPVARDLSIGLLPD